MEPIAMNAPVRAWFLITPALNGTDTVHVHVIFTDIPFANNEQLPAISVRIPSLSDRSRTEIARLSRVRSQRDPLPEEPETPTRAVSRRHRSHLLSVPVEGLVILAALIQTPCLPVVLTGSWLTVTWLIGPTHRRVGLTATARLRCGRT
jgi:hypothetical protein